MKLWKKVLAVACALSLICGTMAGCGSKEQGVDNSVEDKKNLKIMIYAKGYGSEWLQAMKEAFEAKNKGITVEIMLVTSPESLNLDIKNPNSDTDLYFNISESGGHSLMDSYKNYYNGGQAMRDLTYLMDTEIPGEGVTLGDKMNSSLKKVYQVDGRETEDTSDDTYYFLPYVTSTMGLYYNETVIDNALGKGNWSVPNTSDELVALCEQLKEKGCCIMLPSTLDQWSYSVFAAWWAQHEGYDNYMKFYRGIGYNESKGREEQNSSLIFQQPGRLEALKATHDVLDYEKGYVLPNTAEITITNLNEYQSRFTIAKNKYAFYPCGDWLLQELASHSTVASDSTIKMMKTPVISSIIDSVDSYSGNKDKRLPNITTDEMLSQVVNYVDGKGELPAGVTEEEVEIVRQARAMIGTRSIIHMVYAPEFSNAKALADQFLLFMASDEGIQVMKDSCVGGFAPYNYEYSNLEGTAESIYEVSKDAVYVTDFTNHELFYRGGISGFAAPKLNATIDGVFVIPGSMTAEELFNSIVSAYEGEAWDSILKKLSQ